MTNLSAAFAREASSSSPFRASKDVKHVGSPKAKQRKHRELVRTVSSSSSSDGDSGNTHEHVIPFVSPPTPKLPTTPGAKRDHPRATIALLGKKKVRKQQRAGVVDSRGNLRTEEDAAREDAEELARRKKVRAKGLESPPPPPPLPQNTRKIAADSPTLRKTQNQRNREEELLAWKEANKRKNENGDRSAALPSSSTTTTLTKKTATTTTSSRRKSASSAASLPMKPSHRCPSPPRILKSGGGRKSVVALSSSSEAAKKRKARGRSLGGSTSSSSSSSSALPPSSQRTIKRRMSEQGRGRKGAANMDGASASDFVTAGSKAMAIVAQLREETKLLRASKEDLEQKLAEERTAHSKTVTSLEARLSAEENARSEAEARAAKSESELASCRVESADLSHKLDSALLELKECRREVRSAQSQLEESRDECSNLEDERNKLCNQVLDLKGSVRVFARLRPFLPGEMKTLGDSSKPQPCIGFPEDDPNRRKLTLYQGNHKEKTHDFQFDKVFPARASQGDIFEEVGPLVQSVLEGYKVCIFAYGQTGSGKTYTMEGSGPVGTEDAGMIPRAIRKLFRDMDRMSKVNPNKSRWTWNALASHLEIYNEKIRDLLVDKKTGGNESKEKKSRKHEIKHGKDGSTAVTGLTVENVSSESDAALLLRRAASNRSVSSTKCNNSSSRSHSVFTMTVEGTDEVTGERRRGGKLTMIDLAGSERVNESGVEGDALREAININKSLSCLGDVIGALSDRSRRSQKQGGGGKKQQQQQHVPFRNSKLTYLLQNVLGGGDARCLMLVNLSPRPDSAGESLCSLRFAAKANSCVVRSSSR